MGVTCEILLRKTKDVYGAGDTVEGTVKYVIDKPTEFTSVTLSLKAKGLCFWAPITTDTKYTETENYNNQLKELLQAKENEAVTVPAGTYKKPFYFALPEKIASSYKDFRCFIYFFIQLEFVGSNLMSLPKKFYLDIPVQGGVKPRVNDEYVEYKINKEFMLSKKVVTLKAGIEKPFLYVGEDVTVILDINNYAEVPLVSSTTELIEFVIYKTNGNRVKQLSKALTGVEMKYLGKTRLKVERSQTHHFSTTPHLFSIDSNMLKKEADPNLVGKKEQMMVLLRKEYGVKVTLKLPFPHRELCLEIPVVIAQKIDDFEEEKLNVQGPLCWQAMNEKNALEE